MVGAPSISKPTSLPLLAFLSDEDSIQKIRQIVSENKWPEECVQSGNAEQAVPYLQQNKSPKFLIVEVPSAQEAPAMLDKLADVCDSGVNVIVTSKTDEYRFFSWLMQMGVHCYLLQPFSIEELKQALTEKKQAAPQDKNEKKAGKAFAFMGTRGGVGTTTILSNLAYLLSKQYGKNTALVDMDPYFGTVSMAYDLEPGKGLREALEKPDRVDALFLDRVMIRFNDHLKILSAEESVKQAIMPHAQAGQTILKEIRTHSDFILMDIPRILTPVTRDLLAGADQTVLVTEISLLGLRDLMRLRDLIHDEMKRPEPIVVANREGLADKFEMKKSDFEKHYGHPIHIHIPCMMEAFSTASTGDMLVETTKNSKGLEGLHELAKLLIGEELDGETAVKPKGMFKKLLKGK